MGGRVPDGILFLIVRKEIEKLKAFCICLFTQKERRFQKENFSREK
jgi:hypothetical protein